MSLHLRKHVVVTDKDYDERTVCCFINPWTQSSIIIMFDRLLCCACWWCRIIKTKSPPEKKNVKHISIKSAAINQIGIRFFDQPILIWILWFFRSMLHYFLIPKYMYGMKNERQCWSIFCNFMHDVEEAL